jgi:hypothetical protein
MLTHLQVAAVQVAALANDAAAPYHTSADVAVITNGGARPNGNA